MCQEHLDKSLYLSKTATLQNHKCIPISVTFTSEMPPRAMENLRASVLEGPSFFTRSLKSLLSHYRTQNLLKLQNISWDIAPARPKHFHSSKTQVCRGQLDMQQTNQLSEEFCMLCKTEKCTDRVDVAQKLSHTPRVSAGPKT